MCSLHQNQNMFAIQISIFMSEHSLRSTLKILETWRKFRNLKIGLMHKRAKDAGSWMWAGFLWGTSVQTQRSFSWCEALKVILVCFERQLGSQWYWLSLQVKEMALRKVGGLALWDFLDFIVRTRIPILCSCALSVQCMLISLSQGEAVIVPMTC